MPYSSTNITQASTNVVDGRVSMRFMEGGIVADKAETMVLHDLGHVIAATDEELTMPNLGLPDSNLLTDRIRECEATAIAVQACLMQAFGQSWPRLVAMGAVLFGYDPATIHRHVELGTYTPKRVADTIRRRLSGNNLRAVA